MHPLLVRQAGPGPQEGQAVRRLKVTPDKDIRMMSTQRIFFIGAYTAAIEKNPLTAALVISTITKLALAGLIRLTGQGYLEVELAMNKLLGAPCGKATTLTKVVAEVRPTAIPTNTVVIVRPTPVAMKNPYTYLAEPTFPCTVNVPTSTFSLLSATAGVPVAVPVRAKVGPYLIEGQNIFDPRLGQEVA